MWHAQPTPEAQHPCQAQSVLRSLPAAGGHHKHSTALHLDIALQAVPSASPGRQTHSESLHPVTNVWEFVEYTVPPYTAELKTKLVRCSVSAEPASA